MRRQLINTLVYDFLPLQIIDEENGNKISIGIGIVVWVRSRISIKENILHLDRYSLLFLVWSNWL